MGPVMHCGSRLLCFRSAPRSSRWIHGSPPEHKVGLLETIIGFSAVSLAILGPAGWFMCHLSSYRKK
ncbi:hypothetical protein DV515_00016937 [Chloebia gouldiae]|uniref:Uncharacterized protein n=1 Tax=Chloebia gouldiae TaxID=44316 RepID=A0A3L8R9W5_CHLGU|nr:hypothetical protein DV515_00016939 [Chloebia gouldiae]RLV76474.1 hypothetical protein DV515_00016940 [Chloebia gouldiae]RLV76475.1 hypothetical protein DV515_00016938 [Chloebia gouldiae]RLV76476.1 hypothetical protein DV515_00016937 [Chloebia gouldiae]